MNCGGLELRSWLSVSDYPIAFIEIPHIAARTACRGLPESVWLLLPHSGSSGSVYGIQPLERHCLALFYFHTPEYPCGYGTHLLECSNSKAVWSVATKYLWTYWLHRSIHGRLPLMISQCRIPPKTHLPSIIRHICEWTGYSVTNICRATLHYTWRWIVKQKRFKCPFWFHAGLNNLNIKLSIPQVIWHLMYAGSRTQTGL